MRDWDTRISELKKNIEAARNRFVIPFLDSKYLEEQVVKDIKSKPTVNEKSETKEIGKKDEIKVSKKTSSLISDYLWSLIDYHFEGLSSIKSFKVVKKLLS